MNSGLYFVPTSLIIAVAAAYASSFEEPTTKEAEDAAPARRLLPLKEPVCSCPLFLFWLICDRHALFYFDESR